jgi:hypothetical protein
MPSFIVIESKKSTEFNTEAKTILEGHKFAELNPGTFMASSASPSTATSQLKNLESYKKNRGVAGIKIYKGSLSQ